MNSDSLLVLVNILLLISVELCQFVQAEDLASQCTREMQKKYGPTHPTLNKNAVRGRCHSWGRGERNKKTMYLKNTCSHLQREHFCPQTNCRWPWTHSTWMPNYSICADYCFAGTNKELQNTTGRRVFWGRNVTPTL